MQKILIMQRILIPIRINMIIALFCVFKVRKKNKLYAYDVTHLEVKCILIFEQRKCKKPKLLIFCVISY